MAVDQARDQKAAHSAVWHCVESGVMFPARKCRLRLCVEILMASVVVTVVCGILSLPSIVYFIPSKQDSVGCASYSKSTCLASLLRSKSYLTGVQENGSSIDVSENVHLEANENSIQVIISHLSLLNATETCISSLIPFMCLHLFPLCDGDGAVPAPTRDQSIEVCRVACKDVWQKAINITGIVRQLSHCESHFHQRKTNGPTTMPNAYDVNSTLVKCKETFYFSDGMCVPQCGKWKQYSERDFIVVDILTFTTAGAGFGLGMLMLILSFIWREKMFKFPAVIIVYMNGTFALLGMLLLISYMDRTAFFCSSQNVIEAVEKSTAFCSIAGAVYYYGISQLSIWWIFHVAILFWKTWFPFHAKRHCKQKAIHVTMVLTAILLPIIPVIAGFLTGGFMINTHPPLMCAARSSDAAYYTIVLPIDIIAAAGTSLLLSVVVAMIKHGRAKEQASKSKFKFGTVEIKILLVLFYYFFLDSEALIAFVLNAKGNGPFAAAVLNYFDCEATGNTADGKCDSERNAYESLNNVTISGISYVLLCLFPVSCIAYVVNCNELKKCCISCIERTKKAVAI